MRARYQVLVLPYRRGDRQPYCIFKRSDTARWQFIAGGGEEEDASTFISAKREALEEANIPWEAAYTQLETVSSISTEHFPARLHWGEDCLVIPEYAFAVEAVDDVISLSDEHTAYEWVDYPTAVNRLEYDSNKVALWELDQKLKMGKIL